MVDSAPERNSESQDSEDTCFEPAEKTVENREETPATQKSHAPIDACGQDSQSGYAPTLDFNEGGPRTGVPLDAGGRVFGDYELIEKISQGGMGVVYRARQKKLNRIVALKMILAGEHASNELIQRFYVEAEAAGHLDHPGIVPVFEVGEHDGQHYFSMGFVEGGSLTARLKEGPLPPREAAELVQHVANAVHFAHSQGIIHRDLKPGNILIDKNGQPKVSDFGVAKRLQGDSNLTITGQIVGTPSYMPPEQAAGKVELIGPPTDIYSLGAILYCCLTGRPPFQAAALLETLKQVQERDPVPPSHLNASVDRDLETICLKSLHKEPAKRYKSAQALADDLCCFLTGKPIAARPVGQIERLARWCRRNPALASATSAAAALLIVALAIAVLFAVSEKRAAESEKRGAEVLRRSVTELRLERGLRLCEEREEAQGLLWFAKALTETPESDPAIERTVRSNMGDWGRHLHHLCAIIPPAPVANVVRTVAFDAAGKTVMVASTAGNERLWEVMEGRKHSGGPEHSGTVIVREFRIGDALNDNDASTEEINTELIKTYKLAHDGRVYAIVSSPDGTRILTGSEDGYARLWDSASGKLLHKLGPQGRVFAAAFSLNGRMIFTGGEDGAGRLWDINTEEILWTSECRHSWILTAAFSPDGKKIITSDTDRSTRFWNAGTGKPIGEPLRHHKNVTAIAFSPDRRTLATAGGDQKLSLWRLDSKTGLPLGDPLHQLQHQHWIVALAFSPDSKAVLTGSWDQTARLWDVETGRSLGQPLQHQGWVWSVAFSPDGKSALSGSGIGDLTARLWKLSSDRPLEREIVHPDGVWSVAFSPDGDRILTSCADKCAQVWDRGTGQRIGSPLRHSDRITVAIFSPDGTRILTGSSDKIARLWDAKTGVQIGKDMIHQGEVHRVAFSPDGKWILTGSWDKKSRFWDSDGGLIAEQDHDNRVTALALSKNGDLYFTGTITGLGQLWDTMSHKPVGPPLPHAGPIWSAAFNPRGGTIATASGDQNVRLWDTDTFTVVGAPVPLKSEANTIAFSPDGNIILAGTDANTARFIDAGTQRLIGPPLLHNGPVRSVAFSLDGKFALTGSEDHIARLWRLCSIEEGDPHQMQLTYSIRSGLELQRDRVHVLDENEWAGLKQRLAQLKK